MESNDAFRMYDLAIEQQKFRIYRNRKRKHQDKETKRKSSPVAKVNDHVDLHDDKRKVMNIPQDARIRFLNIYMNNKITNRSIHQLEGTTKMVENVKRINSNHLASKPPKFEMIVPYIEIKHPKLMEQSHNQPLHHQNKTISLAGKVSITNPTKRSQDVETTQFSKQIRKDEKSSSDYMQSAKKFGHSIPLYTHENLRKRIQSSQKMERRESNPDKFKQENIENIVRRKANGLSFNEYMVEFSRRLQNPSDAKYFVFKSPDEYIKRILLQSGWVQNPSQISPFFHLKWVSSDFGEKYEFEEGQQFYNHFKHNLKLTTKIGLHKYFYSQNRQRHECYYPRSYDPACQYDEFLEQYQKTSILCMLKKHINHIQSRLDSTIINQFSRQAASHAKLKIMLDQGTFYSTNNANFQINVPLAIQMCLYLENWKSKIVNGHPVYGLEPKTIEKLINFSKLNPPYELYNTIRKSDLLNQDKGQQEQTKVTFSENFNRYSSLSSFHTPSTSLLELIYAYHQYFKKILPYYDIEGIKNIWILKSCTSSKGIGITLEQKRQIIQDKKDNKIIQKYLQNCLIFTSVSDSKFKFLERRKFDIRQWVLVKSFDPLVVYFYKEFYIRICSQEYDLQDTKNLSRHLTNYHQNKGNFRNQENSVIHSTNFKLLIKNEFKVDFQCQIAPLMKNIIIQTLNCYKTKIQPNKSSFELYGFDFLITNTFKPYMLQVNLSPACLERTKWLTNMVQNMGRSMFKIILPAHLFPCQQNNQNQWELIFNQQINN